MLSLVFLLVGVGLPIAVGILIVVVTTSIRRKAAVGRYIWWLWMLIPLPLFLVLSGVPRQVDDVAYLAGAGRLVLFLPQSQGAGVTAGVLATGQHISWPTTVPVGKPFVVRLPVWDTGSGRTLIPNDTRAATNLAGGLLVDLLGLLFAQVIRVRRARRRP